MGDDGRRLGAKIAGGFVLLSVAAAVLPMRRHVERLTRDEFVVWAAAVAWVVALPAVFLLALRLVRRWLGRPAPFGPWRTGFLRYAAAQSLQPMTPRLPTMENTSAPPETSWRCGKCGYTLTAPQPPATCPSCHEPCDFLNVTCYTPDCAFQGTDQRLK